VGTAHPTGVHSPRLRNDGLKGQPILAQGNVLGLEITPSTVALKGQHKYNHLITLPLQGI
jgi:hypothetical protein